VRALQVSALSDVIAFASLMHHAADGRMWQSRDNGGVQDHNQSGVSLSFPLSSSNYRRTRWKTRTQWRHFYCAAITPRPIAPTWPPSPNTADIEEQDQRADEALVVYADIGANARPDTSDTFTPRAHAASVQFFSAAVVLELRAVRRSCSLLVVAACCHVLYSNQCMSVSLSVCFRGVSNLLRSQ
jgi:hypothetical protein